jgi:hypothetical protein
MTFVAVWWEYVWKTGSYTYDSVMGLWHTWLRFKYSRYSFMKNNSAIERKFTRWLKSEQKVGQNPYEVLSINHYKGKELFLLKNWLKGTVSPMLFINCGIKNRPALTLISGSKRFSQEKPLSGLILGLRRPTLCEFTCHSKSEAPSCNSGANVILQSIRNLG